MRRIFPSMMNPRTKMDDELIEKLKYLRLGALLANWDHYLLT
jgi:hypothetical protein